MPWALKFLLGFEGNVGGVEQEALPAIGNYLNFVTRFLFGFGVAFLTPVLLMILERAGIVTREQLAGRGATRSSSAAGVSAVLTPPDVVSMLLMLVPLYSLYEFALARNPCDALARGREQQRTRLPTMATRSGAIWARNRHRGGGGLAVPGPFVTDSESGGAKSSLSEE